MYGPPPNCKRFDVDRMDCPRKCSGSGVNDLTLLQVCILSLVGPGIQAITDTRQAVAIARQGNDHLAENIAKNPRRLRYSRSWHCKAPKCCSGTDALC